MIWITLVFFKTCKLEALTSRAFRIMSRIDISAFVINLDRQPERMGRFEQAVQEIGIAVERFSAVDGQDLSDINDLIHPLMHLVHEPRKFNIRAHVGCFLSHAKVWKQITQRKAPWSLILEDDVRPTNISLGFLEAFGRAPPPFDIVRLHSNAGSQKPGRQRETGVEIDGIKLTVDMLGARSTGAYLISCEGAQKCLAYKKMISPVDHFEWLFQQHGVVHVQTQSNIFALDEECSSSITPKRRKFRLDRPFTQLKTTAVHQTWVRNIMRRNFAEACARVASAQENFPNKFKVETQKHASLCD